MKITSWAKQVYENSKDRWITWRTGKDKSQREWEAWYTENVDYRAGNIATMFRNFEHVIEVDWRKFITDGGMSCWVPVEDARQYFWPARDVGNNCVWRIEQVSKGQWGEWYIDNCWGEDRVFVATNNERDAIIIAMKYGG